MSNLEEKEQAEPLVLVTDSMAPIIIERGSLFKLCLIIWPLLLSNCRVIIIIEASASMDSDPDHDFSIAAFLSFVHISDRIPIIRQRFFPFCFWIRFLASSITSPQAEQAQTPLSNFGNFGIRHTNCIYPLSSPWLACALPKKLAVCARLAD